jgi:rare lipoprotein A
MKGKPFGAVVLALVAVGGLAMMGSCATPKRPGGYYQDDGPEPAPPADVMKVPDALPRHEPLSAWGNKPYTVFNVDYAPMASADGYHERGIASWYGKKFQGKPTSSREPYDMYAMTAAHKTLPLPSYVRVRNLENGREVVVRVNDRGPFLHNRLIDLSYAAAARLGILSKGTGLVEVSGVTAARPPAPETIEARPPQLFL